MKSESKKGGINLAQGFREVASLPREMSVVTSELTRMFHCVARTISRWRKDGILPAAFKIGNANAWKVGTILDHWQKLQDDAVKLGSERARRLAAVVAGTAAEERARLNTNNNGKVLSIMTGERGRPFN